MSNFYRGPAIDASYQVSVHLAKLFQVKILATDDDYGEILLLLCDI
jgi:hypothetical protein